MPFAEKDSPAKDFRLFQLAGDQSMKFSILLLCDRVPGDYELKLLQNFHRLGREVLLIFPKEDAVFNDSFDFSPIVSMMRMLPGNILLVSMGGFSPYLVDNFRHLEGVGKVVFVNPAYMKDISTKMSGFELPVLVLTGTPGNLDHDPDAVKYHDLISGSVITYVRGVEGNPLYQRFTQSFNSIQRFLLND